MERRDGREDYKVEKWWKVKWKVGTEGVRRREKVKQRGKHEKDPSREWAEVKEWWMEMKEREGKTKEEQMI